MEILADATPCACSISVAVFAVFAAGLLNVVPTASKLTFYADMFRRWSDLRQDADSLAIDVKLSGDNPENAEYLEMRYRELLAKKNALNAREPAPDEQLLHDCLVREERSRGVLAPETPQEQFHPVMLLPATHS